MVLYRRTQVPRRRFRSENITISLTVSQNTAHLSISDIQTFTIWCERFSVFFTRLDLPTDVEIAPVVSQSTTLQLHTQHTHTHTHRYTHAHALTCTLTQTHMHAYTYTHAYMHIHTYIRIHAQMCAHTSYVL